MDTQKIGSLIYSLRKEKGMTQAELAQQLHITDKTVSKWDRGKGAPDVSLLADLSAVFQVDLEKLLAGELEVNQPVIGNMRKLRFARFAAICFFRLMKRQCTAAAKR